MLPFPMISNTNSLPNTPFSEIAIGESHLLVLHQNGNLYASGSNTNQQLNQSTGTGTGSYNNFILMDTSVNRVWAGDNSTLYLKGDNLYFCGLNTNTNSTYITSGLLQQMPLPSGLVGDNIKHIRIFQDRGFALITNDGRAFCHGNNTVTSFRAYLDSSTGNATSYPYNDDASINTVWAEVIITIAPGVKILDWKINTSYGSAAILSGTFIGDNALVYRHLNGGWNNISTTSSSYYKSSSFVAGASVNTLGYDYNSNQLFRRYHSVLGTTMSMHSILYSNSNISHSTASGIGVDPKEPGTVVTLSSSNGASTKINVGGVIKSILPRTNQHGILSTVGVYILSKAGILTEVDCSTIYP